MCAAAISFARIRRLYYGAADPKGGAVENGVRFFAAPTCHHRPEVYGGIGEAEAAALLKDFFRRGADGSRARYQQRYPHCRCGVPSTRIAPSRLLPDRGGIMNKSFAHSPLAGLPRSGARRSAQEQQSFKSLVGRGFDIKSVTFARGEATENRETFMVTLQKEKSVAVCFFVAPSLDHA